MTPLTEPSHRIVSPSVRAALARSAVALAVGVFAASAGVARGEVSDPDFGSTATARYLPAGTVYDAAVPRPETVLGHDVGAWHASPGAVVRYFERLAATSDRVRVETIGRTHERRPLIVATITAPERLERFEEVLASHRSAFDAGEPEPPDAPAFVLQMFSVHGNEASAMNAAPLVAYWLAAAQGPEVEALLDALVVRIDPCLNPDGANRFATWVNTNKPHAALFDPSDREHREPWPSGRTNHYGFDLNRDWLPASQPESRARLEAFHRFRPHLVTDHHEMGTNATMFFQPGVPSRNNPWTPTRVIELTAEVARFHADVLDADGRRYYTEETFDDFYYGKGSTYPDVNGAVGILFEQASVRGHRNRGVHGKVDFAYAVEGQVLTALSTLEAARALRPALLEHHATFWSGALDAAGRDDVRAFVVGDADDPERFGAFVELLLRHRVEVLELARPVEVDGVRFAPGRAVAVPTDQRQYRLVRALFERRTTFEDETFYDVSAWTLPLAFGLPDAAMKVVRTGDLGERVAEAPAAAGRFEPVEDAVAYAFAWDRYGAPRALRRLHGAELPTYAAKRPLSLPAVGAGSGVEDPVDATTVELAEGAIVVPVPPSEAVRRKIESVLATVAERDRLDVVPVTSGLTPVGIDMGSPSLRRVEPVAPLLVVGRGVDVYEAGSTWHYLDRVLGIPVTRVDTDRLGRVDLGAYTHVVMVDGRYGALGERDVERLRRFVSGGGVLVASRRAAGWVTEHGLDRAPRGSADAAAEPGSADRRTDAAAGGADEGGTVDDAAARRRPYADYVEDVARDRIAGALVAVDVDLTHPLAYGVRESRTTWFRRGTTFLDVSDNPYETVAVYPDDPLVAGFLSDERRGDLANGAAVVASRVGRGLVVRFADGPTFRGFWLGTHRFLANALFFSRMVDRTELEQRERKAEH